MGIFALVDVIMSLLLNRISINFGVLGLFIGPGLLALRPGWRSCAIVIFWISMIGLPIVAFFMLGHYGPLELKVFGQKVGYASKSFGLALVILFFFLTVWQYRVLTDPGIRRLFGVEDG